MVAAVKAGGPVDTLESPGPFAVFTPTNEAFAALHAGTVDTLLKRENRDTLDKILTYRGQRGAQNRAGGALTVQGAGKNLVVTDEKSGTAHIRRRPGRRRSADAELRLRRRDTDD